MKFLHVLASAAIALALNANSNAALVYDGFEYTEAAGTSINGLNGGIGWSEAYTTADGISRLGAGLSFTGHFASAGQSMERLASATLTPNGRNWAASVADGTYWYSFLMNPASTPTANGRGTFGVLQGSATNQNGFGIRYDITGTAGPGATLVINANTPAQAPGANISFPSGWDQTYLVLGRLTVNNAANTVNDIWAFQNGATLPTSVAGLGAVMSTSQGATAGVNPALYGRAFGGTASTFFDEIRVGNTFSEVMVTAVPEPSTVALLGVAASAFAVYRRRKSSLAA